MSSGTDQKGSGKTYAIGSKSGLIVVCITAAIAKSENGIGWRSIISPVKALSRSCYSAEAHVRKSSKTYASGKAIRPFNTASRIVRVASIVVTSSFGA